MSQGNNKQSSVPVAANIATTTKDLNLSINTNPKSNQLIPIEDATLMNFKIHSNVAKSGKDIDIKDWGGNRFRKKKAREGGKGFDYVDYYVDDNNNAHEINGTIEIGNNSIQSVINSIHPDVKKFISNSSRICSYKAAADSLLITLTTGLRILIIQHCDKKKHYIVKLKRDVLLDKIG